MDSITIHPVRSHSEHELFLTFPWRIYKGDPLWVPPLLPDWRERTDPKRGVFFQRGEAEYFIAWREGKPVGTICAAVDRQANQERSLKQCVFGFFDFVDDYEVFTALLGQVIRWAQERGLDGLTGPFNLDYEDSYGVLVEGRDRPPALMCGHSPAYYLAFYERYGFEPARGDNIAFAIDLTVHNPAIESLGRMTERVRQRTSITVRSANLARWEEELERIYILLNLALAHLPDFRAWPREVVFNSLSPFRKIVDPELILFAQDGEKTIGWLPGLPNLNEAFIHANGLRRPWNYLGLWWRMRHQTECLTIKSGLLLPEYWGGGAVVLLFNEMASRARAKGYRWIDASLTSTDNPRTPALGERFGAKIYKRYRVYKKKI